MLAGEARVAMRAAEAASKAAEEAHAAAQYVLAGLEAAAACPAWGADDLPDPAALRLVEPAAAPGSPREEAPFDEHSQFAAHAEAEEAERPGEPAQSPAEPRYRRAAIVEAGMTEERESALPAPATREEEQMIGTDPAQPIYGNLIQFPREMVATRKMRPRRAEGPLATAAPEAQLSIFEVDPATISTQPAVVVEEPAAPDWMRTELESVAVEPEPVEELLEEPEPAVAASAAIELAPMSRRLLAHVVDASLIVGSFLGAAATVGAHASALPGPRAAALGSALAILAIGAAYQVLFVTLTGETPGMRYAGLGFGAFSGGPASVAQRCGRLMALPLSVLPLGLGLAWALFDDGGLAWHDRLSRTYLRKR